MPKVRFSFDSRGDRIDLGKVDVPAVPRIGESVVATVVGRAHVCKVVDVQHELIDEFSFITICITPNAELSQ